MRRAGVVLVALAGAVVGLAAERAAFSWDEVELWLPDLVVGWTFIGCGVAAWAHRGDSRSGPLLTATGFAWFLGNVAGSDAAVVAWIGANLVFVHRALLVHAVLSFPTGRLTGVVDRVFVLATYLVVLTPAARSTTVTVLLGALLVLVAARSEARPAGRRSRSTRLQASLAVGVALAGSALLQAVTDASADRVVLLAYEILLCGVAVGLLAALLRSPSERAALTDLVVELTGSPDATLRDALANALGDPSLEVGFWIDDAQEYVDAEGRAVGIPTAGSDRAVTRLVSDGRPLALLVHAAAILDDPVLVESVAAAARLASVNARLRADVQAQSAEVVASRRRLLQAADGERRRLQQRLESGAGRHLQTVRAELGEALLSARSADPPSEVQLRLAAAEDQLEDASASLRDLSRGLHPPLLRTAGLRGAVLELARHCPSDVTVRVTSDSLPRDVEVTAYYVCAEALANVTKHAGATSVDVKADVTEGELVVTVADDGSGGASCEHGTGLRGVADRVEALGGRLSLESERDRGTRLVATLPLGDQPG